MNRMTETTLIQFRKELDSFFLVLSMNMAAGALAMAFGMQYLVARILDLRVLEMPVFLRVPAAVFFLICIGLGLGWVLTSARVLRDIKSVRRESRRHAGPVPDELLTCWIVRTLAHYRENRSTVRRMCMVATLGGCAFLALGTSNLLQGLGILPMGMPAFALAAAAINLTVGCISLLGTLYFRRYAAAWDLRIASAARSEQALQCALERT